jgi:RNA polymerase sigma-70 factor (family 1)
MTAENEKRYVQFKLVFEEYYVALGNFAYTFTRDKTASEDIVQEIFLRIWEKRPDLIGSSSIRFYLFTAVRNNCLTYLEQSKKILPIDAAGLENRADIYPVDKPEDPPVDRIAIIQQAISLLPPKCREVFLLSRMGSLSYKEIAKSLGISVKTVDNQMGKALKTLRSVLKEHKYFFLLVGITCIQLLNSGSIGDFMKRLFF